MTSLARFGLQSPENRKIPGRGAGGVVISRRQMLGYGIAASALGVTCPSAEALASGPPAGPPVTLLVVDERFEVARHLARSFPGYGVRRVALSRDVLDLW